MCKVHVRLRDTPWPWLALSFAHSPGGLVAGASESSKLQEQLHHLLSILQHALELHSQDGLPNGVAPQLADELEAVAKRLKRKERVSPGSRVSNVTGGHVIQG
jgi:hypothetical protein